MAEEKRCLNCDKVLTWRQMRFCSSKCKAHYNNYKEVEKECPRCWKTFIWRNYITFCSDVCARESVSERETGFNCLYCWKALHWTQKKFCCYECKYQYKNRNLLEKECKICWKIYLGTLKSKYCSDDLETIKDTMLELRIMKYVKYDSETNMLLAGPSRYDEWDDSIIEDLHNKTQKKNKSDKER